MLNFFQRIFLVTFNPEEFFEQVREDKSWLRPICHLLGLSFLLAAASVIAWGAGMPGDTPVNASLGAQMDIYPFWRDTLLPQYNFLAYPMAIGLIMLEMIIISAIWIPILFVVFHYLGGAKESWKVGLLHAVQGFIYGLSPCVLGGYIPYLALLVGVYATILQFFRGPAITLRNKSFVPYLFLALFLAFVILRYWQGALL